MRTPIGRRRTRIRPRCRSATASSSIHRASCSRCGTWAATSRTRATRSHTTASTGTSPSLDVVKGTNIVMTANRDSSTVWIDQTSPIRSGATRWRRRTTTISNSSSRRTAFTGRRPATPVSRAIARRSSTTRSETCGCSACDRPGRRRHATACYFETRDFVGGTHWSDDRTRAVGGRRQSGSEAPGIQRPDGTVQPRLRRVREHPARPVHDLSRRASAAREAERRLRRLQPRRLSLGASRSRRVPAGVRTLRRLELGQRAIGRRRLPDRRRQAATST